jgi:transcriptional regulator with XRE-family HTH domain
VGRVIFQGNDQGDFLEEIKILSGLKVDEIALICGVSPRTFRDWMRNKFTITETALKSLCNRLDIPIPSNIKIVDNYWYVYKGARLGAAKRFELYGHLGTPEGRKLGGINSQIRRKENPEKYRLLNCNIRKQFKIKIPSTEFAEVAGIILGDGAITNDQIRISLSGIVDRDYSEFVANLFTEVFSERPSILEYKYKNTLEILISGIQLVEELERWGFRRGHKVRNQVNFPNWIWNNLE